MGTLQIRHLTFCYDTMEKPLFDDVTLQIDESWRLGLIGRNGRGRPRCFDCCSTSWPIQERSKRI